MADTNQQAVILAIEADWLAPWANLPTMRVTLSARPAYHECRFAKKPMSRGSLYFALAQPMAMFFFYEKPGEGFGGSKYTLTLEDGSQEELVGPWASSESQLNAAGFTMTADCAWRVGDDTMHGRPYYGRAGHVTVEAVNAWLAEHAEADWYLAQAGVQFFPHPKEGCYEDRKDKKPVHSRCPVCQTATSRALSMNPELGGDQLEVVGA